MGLLHTYNSFLLFGYRYYFGNCSIPSENETTSDSSLGSGSSCCLQWRGGTREICEKSQCLQCCHFPQLCLWSFQRLQWNLLPLVRVQFTRGNRFHCSRWKLHRQS